MDIIRFPFLNLLFEFKVDRLNNRNNKCITSNVELSLLANTFSSTKFDFSFIPRVLDWVSILFTKSWKIDSKTTFLESVSKTGLSTF